MYNDDYYGTYSASRVPSAASAYHQQGTYVRQSPNYSSSLDPREKRRSSTFRCCTCVAAFFFVLLIILIVLAIIAIFTMQNTKLFQLFGGGVGVAAAGLRGTVHSPKLAIVRGLAAGKDRARMIERREVERLLTDEPNGICLFDTAYLSEEYREDYDEEHIKGAKHFDIEMVVNRSITYRRQLLHPTIFEEYARSLGVTRDCLVVLYHHGERYKSQLSATYVWWLFKIHGHDKTAVMVGGLPEWKNETHLGAPVVSSATNISQMPADIRGNFVAKWNRQIFSNLRDVVDNFDSDVYDLVDARTASDFRGETKSRLASENGRVKDAISITADSVLNSDWSLKSDDELRRLAQDAGLDYNRAVITYCNTGMQSSAVQFMLVRLGYTATMYNGGWVQFSRLGPPQYKVMP